MSLRQALDRTLLLMRDDLKESVLDEQLLSALTETSVTIVADSKNLHSHSAQTAFVTLALLLARSGHRVRLAAPELMLHGAQPPLGNGDMMEQLQIIGKMLLPGISFEIGMPKRTSDLTIILGDAPWSADSDQTIRIRATAWQVRLTPGEVRREWPNEDWPMGGMAAAALAATEVFKLAMRRLGRWARDQEWFSELYAPTPAVMINLAPFNPPMVSALDSIDFISGGAITNCALYALLRLPNVAGSVRVVEDDTIALSNLNRCMLFLSSRQGQLKANELSVYATKNLSIRPIIARYDAETATRMGPLSDAVFVGVDDIPARWDVQRAWPKWLSVGATTHFSAMASHHTPDRACAGCLHPTNDLTPGPIPTVAFVSFWAGLWQASLYLRHLASDRLLDRDQYIYFSPLRPETMWWSRLQRRPDCPVSCSEMLRSTG